MAGSDFLAKIKLTLEGKEQVVSGLQQTQQAAQKLSKTKVTTIFDKQGLVTGQKIEETFTKIKPAATGSSKAVGDFEKALRRAAIVAPVWMALRTTIQTVLSTIQDGFRTWMEFDQQLIKSKAVIHDFAGTTDQAMIELEDTIRNFSKESGISLKDLASSFYRFGTVGIAFSDALSGAIASAKLAKSTFGDTDTISRSLSMTYRLLGDTIDSTLSPMEKQESLAGKILHLWKTNAFEANEFASSLDNFASQANIANFTADQTVALLASLGTAGIKGARGGTLLKTAIVKLVENLDELAPKLGIAVVPELENTFEVFMKVLTVINKLSQTTGIPVEAQESIQNIFGGVRGGQVISALNALLPEVKKNLEDLGKDPQEFIKELNDRFTEVTDTVSGQIDIFARLKEQIGEAFVKGLVGGNDFKESLKTINTLMEQLAVVSRNIGDFFKFAGNPVGYLKDSIKEINLSEEEFSKRVKDAESGLLSLQDTVATINMVADRWGKDAYTEDVMKRIQNTAAEIAKTGYTQERVNKIIEDYNTNVIQSGKNVEKQINPHLNLLRQLELQTKTAREGLEITKLQQAGFSDSDIAMAKLSQQVTKMVNEYNGLDRVIDGTLPKLNKQDIIYDAINQNWQGIIDKSHDEVGVVGQLTELAKLENQLMGARLKDADELISTTTSILGILGEEESTIIRQEIALKSMMYGEDYLKNSMDDRVKLAKALTKEAEEQEKSSSRLVELFKIAKKYGKGVAQEVSEFMGGTRQFEELGPTAKKALKRTSPGEFEAGQAKEYFRGTNFAFPEQIEKERKQARAAQILASVMVEPITVNVNLESEQVINKTTQAISDALSDKKSEISTKIRNQIEQF